MTQLKLGDGNTVDVGLGNYLRADKIVDGAIGVLLDAGTIREADFGDGKVKTVVEFSIEVDGEQYTWTVNKQTLDALGVGYGEDCKKWIGKKVKLNKVKMNVFGQMKNVIMGEPVEVKEKDAEEKKVKTVRI